MLMVCDDVGVCWMMLMCVMMVKGDVEGCVCVCDGLKSGVMMLSCVDEDDFCGDDGVMEV